MTEAGPSSSSNAGSSKPIKPPQPAVSNGDAASKAKSAKELKKEKRAAAVASRPGPPPDPSTERRGSQPLENGSATSSKRPTQNEPSSNNPAHTNAGPSAPRRPLHIQHPSAINASGYTNAQQNLFFSHLPSHKPPNTAEAFNNAKLHPSVVRLGVLMSSGTLRGANARTMGIMAAFQEVIRDYTCPDQAVLWKDLPVHLSPMISFLEECRPKGVGGGNAIRWLKSEINRLGEEGGRTEAEQKSYLIDVIGVYIRDRIEFADQVIADNAKEKIRPGDTVVTYARSSIVELVLLEAWRDMRTKDPEASFNVIVVDSRPLLEGRHLLDSLSAAGIPCTYLLLPLLSTLLPRASLVLLGASALHSDGALYSRCGTALVAMLAKEHRVPVVACVETYKFGERVVLDGIATNELGDTESILKVAGRKTVKGLREGVDKGTLTPLSLMYDLTPPGLITAVCTEIGFIPPSSVPTVLGKASGVI